jgi:ankyrin repeat protein
MKATAPTLWHKTVLGFVASKRNVKNFREIIEALQKLGADIKSTQGGILELREYPFHMAIYSYLSILSGKPDLDRLRILKELGADINARNLGGWTPLMMAVQDISLGLGLKEVNLEVIGELLKLGADVNAADNEGDTSLHYAARAGDLKLLKLLHDDFKADPTKKNKTGRPPLDYAKNDETKAYLSAASNKSPPQGG